jgi:hypothetical protein
MARAEMGDEAISANLAAHGNFFVSRFSRGLLFYGVAWVLGAILLSALHLAFPPADGNSVRSPAAPIVTPAQSPPAKQPGESHAPVAGAL